MDIPTQLEAGTVEILPNGAQLPRAPSALAIRAAKHIRNLEGQHQVHLQAIMQLQARESSLLQDLELFRLRVKELDAELQNLRESRG